MVEIQLAAWISAGIFAILAFVTSMYLIIMHLKHYTRPLLQRPIIRILYMVPVYVIDSWLSLRFKDISIYFDLIRDSYEAYVIYQFFILLVNFINTYQYEGEEQEFLVGLDDSSPKFTNSRDFDVESSKSRVTPIKSLKKLEGDSIETKEERVIVILEAKGPINHPWPLSKYTFIPNRQFLLWTRRGILQFVVVKPILALMAIFLELLGVYGDGEIAKFNRGYVYKVIIENISITLAMYFLVLFYQATSIELNPFKPIPKFFCIKAVIFFSWWQGVIISLLVFFKVIDDTSNFTKRDIATGLQDFLICLEMFPIALAHAYAFGYATYRDPERTPLVPKGNFQLTNLKPLAKNMGDVLSPKDMVDDTIAVFGLDEGARKVKELGQRGFERAAEHINSMEKMRKELGGKKGKGGQYTDISDLHTAGVQPSYQNIFTEVYSSDEEGEEAKGAETTHEFL